MRSSKGKAKASNNQKRPEKKPKPEPEPADKSDSVLAVMEQLDFVSELLYSWRDSLVHQLAAAETKEELESNFGYQFLKDRRVFPGKEEGWVDILMKRGLSDGVEGPVEEGQREVVESFLDVIRNTKNYAKLSSDELATFNRVMDEAMLRWALVKFQQVNIANTTNPGPQDSENMDF